ncbi:exported hypothetical protein [Cupriavidus taiwanensis]|uniref:Uncharacterized protein n=1 Tax=Cupriavidus taiwanensis TaxID=164546 RepID=A0A375C615_9BURK|nr:exported hypothetical protein [Cupriavidus taiwanensis]
MRWTCPCACSCATTARAAPGRAPVTPTLEQASTVHGFSNVPDNIAIAPWPAYLASMSKFVSEMI